MSSNNRKRRRKKSKRARLYLFGGGILAAMVLLLVLGLTSSAGRTEARADAGKKENKKQENPAGQADSVTAYSALEVEGPFVIVLDPGHDSCHIGAEANGLKEEDVDWLLAQKIKEELETYRDVAVYYTVENNQCTWKNLDATEELGARADKAADYHANLLVSLHFNYSDRKSQSGFTIYYPNANYKPLLSQEGAGAAASIERQLSDLGLADEGIKTMESEDNPDYPDHSTADYHGIIRHSKLKGFTGILIEHCYISNIHDVYNFMNSDEGIAKLAHADAQGIADYYGLVKK
ncbi:MAG: N-acetylmuramoyl-L-alanine amidase [Eubacterium sp.]|nr:N-acetylmuramoyl-L-alanine amidase [Eubacterium sp.]